MPAHSLLFSRSTKGAARLNVPIRRTNRYQQYYIPSQHTYSGRVWNLIQECDIQSSDYKVYISTPPSPEVENFQLKIYYPRRGSNPGHAEPEVDMLPSEPARRARNNFVDLYVLTMHVSYRWRYVTTVLPAFARNVFYGGCSVFI